MRKKVWIFCIVGFIFLVCINLIIYGKNESNKISELENDNIVVGEIQNEGDKEIEEREQKLTNTYGDGRNIGETNIDQSNMDDVEHEDKSSKIDFEDENRELSEERASDVGHVKNSTKKHSQSISDKTEQFQTEQPDISDKESVFTVIFKDYDGSELKVEEVNRGEDATAPQQPSRDGYRFLKWDTAFENVKVNIVVTAVYEKLTEPSLLVENVLAKAGDTVCVAVSTYKNPGVLGMAAEITFAEDVMALAKVENGKLLSEYAFTPPKNLRSGCKAAWSVNDVPSDIQDGEILMLYFDISDTAQKGIYPISVSCGQNAFDKDYNTIEFDSINGSIVIE